MWRDARLPAVASRRAEVARWRGGSSAKPVSRTTPRPRRSGTAAGPGIRSSRISRSRAGRTSQHGVEQSLVDARDQGLRSHSLAGAVRAVRDLSHRWRAPEFARERARHALHAHATFPDGAWHTHGPHSVAVVALELTLDGRHRERREREPARRVETIDRLHQAHRRDLLEVVEILTTAHAPRQPTRKWQKAIHQRHPRGRVPGMQTLEQRLLFRPARIRVLGTSRGERSDSS